MGQNNEQGILSLFLWVSLALALFPPPFHLLSSLSVGGGGFEPYLVMLRDYFCFCSEIISGRGFGWGPPGLPGG